MNKYVILNIKKYACIYRNILYLSKENAKNTGDRNKDIFP